MSILFNLFIAFFKIGLFSIGGGYAIIPMINEQVVVTSHWLTTQEFTDIITISQMTPGPLAVNTSTFVGMRVAGIGGALVSTIGCICMGILIAFAIYHIFQKFSTSLYFMEVLRGLKASSLGLIASAAAIILSLAFFGSSALHFENINYIAILIFIIIIALSRKFKSNPILLMVISGILGVFFYS